MGEIETQAISGNQGAFLLHMPAEHLPQRGMEQVGRGMIEHDGTAALFIDARLETIAEAQLTGLELADVRVRRSKSDCIRDDEPCVGR
jgi:hypothetical protein